VKSILRLANAAEFSLWIAAIAAVTLPSEVASLLYHNKFQDHYVKESTILDRFRRTSIKFQKISSNEVFKNIDRIVSVWGGTEWITYRTIESSPVLWIKA